MASELTTKRVYKKRSPAMWLRQILLGGLLIYVSYIGYMHLQRQTAFPPVDAICPFGGLESLYSVIFHGQYLQRIYISSFILLGITLLLVIVTGRTFCGWICPLGTLQGIAGLIGRRVFGFKQRLSLEQDNRVRWLRYVALIVFTVGAWMGGKLLIRPYDPWVAWMHIWEPIDMIRGFPIGFAILIGSLITAMVIPRAFCRYLCPMGIFLGIANRLSFTRITVNQETCIHCLACDRKCPVGIPIANATVVDQTDCLSCGECIPVCPVPNTIQFETNRRRVSPMALGVTVIVIFFGVIGLTKAVGIYQSTPPHVSEMRKSGNISPDDIKGYMTLNEVADLFSLPLDSLYNRLGLDRSQVPPDTKGRDISSIVEGFETDNIRLVVADMLAVPPPTSSCGNESRGESAPAIMGIHTLREVARDNCIELGALYRELGLDSLTIPPDTPCRELKNIISPDFHTSRVREAVAAIKAASGIDGSQNERGRRRRGR